MGGIIGKLSFEHDETLAVPALEQMLSTLRPRGAVGSGIHIAPGIAIGWCGDHAPPINSPAVATSEDGTVHVVADSALTHTSALRGELERRGHRMRCWRDADLIAHAYAEWGDACVEHLSGPFACAIWDGAGERLLLARDRIGIRPLFFAVLHGHGIVFASDIRALLRDPGVGRDWCPEAIDAYFALGYVPAPLTVYQRVSTLEPAQRLVVEGRRFHLDQYWDFPIAGTAGETQPGDALEETLHDAIRAQLIDPEITATLYRGGVASTALLACAPAGLDAIVVTTGGEDEQIDRAIAVARGLQAEPRLETTRPLAATLAPELAAHLDEPIADPAAVSQYATLVAARRYASQALSGHGAATFWRNRSHAPAAHPIPPPRLLWNDRERHALYTRGFAWCVREANPMARRGELMAGRSDTDLLHRERYVEATTALPDSTLAIADRVALAAGMTLHLPFLDRAVVELACRLDPHAARPHHPLDPLMALIARRVPYTLLPSTIDTRGPHASTVASRYPWLPAALNTLVPSVLLGPRFDGRGIVSRPVVRRLWDEHTARRADHSHRLWSLLMLEFWFRHFVDGDAAADEPFEYAVLRAA